MKYIFLSILFICLCIVFFYLIKTINKGSVKDINEIRNYLHKDSGNHYIDQYIVNKNLNNIPIYYINLKRSSDRNKFILDQTDYYNVTNIKRVEGIDGKLIKKGRSGDIDYGTCETPDGNKFFYIKNKNGHRVSDNEIGCTLSHLKAVKQAYDDDKEYAIIMEDDTSFDLVPLWEQSLMELMRKIPEDWEIINLCPDMRCCKNYKKQKKDIPTAIDWKDNSCWGAVIYLINRKGMEKIIKQLNIKGSTGKNKRIDINFKDIDYEEITKRIPNIKEKKCYNFIVADCILYVLCNTYQYTKRALFFTYVFNIGSTINDNVFRVYIFSKQTLNLLKDYRSEYEKCKI